MMALAVAAVIANVRDNFCRGVRKRALHHRRPVTCACQCGYHRVAVTGGFRWRRHGRLQEQRVGCGDRVADVGGERGDGGKFFLGFLGKLCRAKHG